MKAHPDLDVVEMDTVKGGRDKGKCLLTLLFRSCSFMIVILMPDCTQRSVIKAINDLTEVLGIRTFKKYFPEILTDNGSEFKNPWDIEKTESGIHRTYVFYCAPYVSNQKGRLEKNHEYIRYVIPKGRSMYRYTQDDINLMTSTSILLRETAQMAQPLLIWPPCVLTKEFLHSLDRLEFRLMMSA